MIKEDIFKDGLKAKREQETKGKINILKKVSKLKPFLLIFLIIITFAIGYSIKKIPECEVCKECTECITCPTLDCETCPKETITLQKTIIRYACTNGLIVDSLNECSPLKHVKIESEYKNTENGIMLSIDKLEYEDLGSYIRITKIDYTIMNIGQIQIKPIILVNMYSKQDEKIEQGIVHHSFDEEEIIGPNEWTIKKHITNIGFNKEDIVVRLVLKDTFQYPNKMLVSVSRDLGI
jgi:hypothetical protein